MPSQEEVNSQKQLLAEYRRRLAHLLRQTSLHGAAHAPPGLLLEIDRSREQIRHIKALLRKWDVEIEDLRDDEVSHPKPRLIELIGRVTVDPMLSTPPFLKIITIAVVIVTSLISLGLLRFTPRILFIPFPTSISSGTTAEPFTATPAAGPPTRTPALPSNTPAPLTSTPTVVPPPITSTPQPPSPTVPGQVEITYPSVMILEEPDIVTVQIMAEQPLTPTSAFLPGATGVISIEARTRDNHRLTAQQAIRLYPVMSVELSAEKFTFDSGKEESRRPIVPNQPAIWTWTISPKERGNEVPLTFKVFGETVLNGEKFTVLAASITRIVNVVDKAWPKKAWDGLTQNAVAIVGTSGPLGLLLAFLGYQQGSKKLKDRVDNLEKTIEEMKKAATPQPEPKVDAPQLEPEAPPPRPSRNKPKVK